MYCPSLAILFSLKIKVMVNLSLYIGLLLDVQVIATRCSLFHSTNYYYSYPRCGSVKIKTCCIAITCIQ